VRFEDVSLNVERWGEVEGGERWEVERWSWRELEV
jgi:hypothetical protein